MPQNHTAEALRPVRFFPLGLLNACMKRKVEVISHLGAVVHVGLTEPVIGAMQGFIRRIRHLLSNASSPGQAGFNTQSLGRWTI